MVQSTMPYGELRKTKESKQSTTPDTLVNLVTVAWRVFGVEVWERVSLACGQGGHHGGLNR